MVQVSLMANNASKIIQLILMLAKQKYCSRSEGNRKIDINPEKIASITRDGNSAVIHLKDGTEIVLENFLLVKIHKFF